LRTKINVLGLEKSPPEKTYPLIELVGQIDCGKKAIAPLLAKRIYGTYLTFPCLNPESFTGRALIAALTTSPRELEKNPGWWFHLYSANLFEFKDQLNGLLKLMPVVVTNYLIGMRTWANATGIDMDHFLKGFSTGLPNTTKAYSIIGSPWDTPGNLRSNFSSEFQFRVNRNMANPHDKRVTKHFIPQDISRSNQLNTIVRELATDIDNRYHTGLDLTALYSHTDFLGKNFK